MSFATSDFGPTWSGVDDAEVYRKSGTWKTFHADSGIVVDPDYSYIIVAITDDPEGAQRLPKIAQAADAAVRKKHVR